MDFFNLRLKAKFKEFQEKEGWRNLSPRHGQEDDDESYYDGEKGEEAGAGVDAGASGGEDGGSAGPEAEVAVAVKVDGKMVSWNGCRTRDPLRSGGFVEQAPCRSACETVAVAALGNISVCKGRQTTNDKPRCLGRG